MDEKNLFSGLKVALLGTLLRTPKDRPHKTDKPFSGNLLRVHRETDYIEADKPSHRMSVAPLVMRSCHIVIAMEFASNPSVFMSDDTSLQPQT